MDSRHTERQAQVWLSGDRHVFAMAGGEAISFVVTAEEKQF